MLKMQFELCAKSIHQTIKQSQSNIYSQWLYHIQHGHVLNMGNTWCGGCR